LELNKTYQYVLASPIIPATEDGMGEPFYRISGFDALYPKYDQYNNKYRIISTTDIRVNKNDAQSNNTIWSDLTGQGKTDDNLIKKGTDLTNYTKATYGDYTLEQPKTFVHEVKVAKDVTIDAPTQYQLDQMTKTSKTADGSSVAVDKNSETTTSDDSTSKVEQPKPGTQVTYKAGDAIPAGIVVPTGVTITDVLQWSFNSDFIDMINPNSAFGYNTEIEFNRVAPTDDTDDKPWVNNQGTFRYNGTEYDTNLVRTKTPSTPPTTRTPGEPQPHKFDLDETKVDLTGDKLLDDDLEMKDRYSDTAKDPYNDKTDNNEPQNLNTKTVKAGETINYQLWLDSTPYDDKSNLQGLGMTDKVDLSKLDLNAEDIKIYNAKGDDVTDLFKVEKASDGTFHIDMNAFKTIKEKDGKDVKVIDNDKLPLGQYYKIDVPTKVKQDIKGDTKILNTANQVVIDQNGDKHVIPTETRVNQTPKTPEKPIVEVPTPLGKLPVTAAQAKGVTLALLAALAGLIGFMKREGLQKGWRKLTRQFKAKG
jgi:adhesin isopeptide-forming family sspB-C2 type protein